MRMGFMLGLLALAFASGQGEVFSFGKERVRFIEDSAATATLSEGCADHGCEAYRKLEQGSVKAARPKLWGGKEPGAAICQTLGGTVRIGTDAKGEENTFCQFSDKSMVDCGSIFYHARENDARSNRK